MQEMEFTRSACAAAQAGDVARLATLIERNPGCVHHDGTGERTGYTPLHYAAHNGRLEVARLLLAPEHGAGALIELEVLDDLYLALSACPQDLTPCNAFDPTSMAIRIWEGA
mgnify:CR=1 FL=1